MASYHLKSVSIYYIIIYIIESYSCPGRMLQEQSTTNNFPDSHFLPKFWVVSQHIYVFVAHIALKELLSLLYLYFLIY